MQPLHYNVPYRLSVVHGGRLQTVAVFQITKSTVWDREIVRSDSLSMSRSQLREAIAKGDIILRV